MSNIALVQQGAPVLDPIPTGTPPLDIRPGVTRYTNSGVVRAHLLDAHGLLADPSEGFIALAWAHHEKHSQRTSVFPHVHEQEALDVKVVREWGIRFPDTGGIHVCDTREQAANAVEHNADLNAVLVYRTRSRSDWMEADDV